MTPIEPRGTRRRLRDALARTGASHAALALGFVVVHTVLVLLTLRYEAAVLGDVHLYGSWGEQGWRTGSWPVLDTDWVYPVLALVPVALVGALPVPVGITFVTLVVLLDAAATWVLVRVARGRVPVGAWWWLLFLLALGPVVLGRLDGLIAPLMVVAAVLGARHPAAATVLATIGAWVKIAPAALVLALLPTTRGVLRRVVVPGALVCLTVIGLAWAGGSGTRVLSVFGTQGERGLQAESVLATPFSLARLVGAGADPVYHPTLFTYEFTARSASEVAAAADLALVAAVLVVLALAVTVVRRRPGARAEAFLVTAQALLLAMVVLNKVGSPQLLAWLAPVVAVAVTATATAAESRRWRRGLVLLPVAALLTQLIYPVAYAEFVQGGTALVVVAALRAALLVWLLVDAVHHLVRLGRTAPVTPVAPR